MMGLGTYVRIRVKRTKCDGFNILTHCKLWFYVSADLGTYPSGRSRLGRYAPGRVVLARLDDAFVGMMAPYRRFWW